MGPICPECQAGKHDNCDGIGGVEGEINNPLPCMCSEAFHPRQRAIVDSTGHPIWDSVEGVMLLVGPSTEVRFHEPVPQDIPGTPPDDDPGIWGAAFPELVGNEPITKRLRPDVSVIRNLSDVEILNPTGEWVPVVPYPVYQFGFIKQCLCGKYRVGTIRYQEHYAYAHILGMDD